MTEPQTVQSKMGEYVKLAWTEIDAKKAFKNPDCVDWH